MLQRYFVIAIAWINSWGTEKLILTHLYFGVMDEWFSALAEENWMWMNVCHCAHACLRACVWVVKTAWLYRGSIWQDLKRLWDMQGFINNHWPHEKLIHSGLENRHYLPCLSHFDVRHPLMPFIHYCTVAAVVCVYYMCKTKTHNTQ